MGLDLLVDHYPFDEAAQALLREPLLADAALPVGAELPEPDAIDEYAITAVRYYLRRPEGEAERRMVEQGILGEFGDWPRVLFLREITKAERREWLPLLRLTMPDVADPALRTVVEDAIFIMETGEAPSRLEGLYTRLAEEDIMQFDMELRTEIDLIEALLPARLR